MSGALLDQLLSGFTRPAAVALPVAPAAKAAKAAKAQQTRGPRDDLPTCEGLRSSANQAAERAPADADSQAFAAIRNDAGGWHSEQKRGDSQDSQDSHRAAAPLPSVSGVAWTDGDFGRFLDRRNRLLRWGWAERDAEGLADRLVRRDRDGDERVSCVDCQHCRMQTCGNFKRAGLGGPALGRDLAGMLQRCGGFECGGATDGDEEG